MKLVLAALAVAGVGVAAFALYGAPKAKPVKKEDARVFELRTYHAAPGKMKALHARFRDHTNRRFPT
jgi:hypothetical protein